MNSIEIAKKLIKENDNIIEAYRHDETASRKRVEELEEEIRRQKEVVTTLETRLAHAKKWLAGIQDNKKEYEVDNLALKVFVAAGGGRDMFD